MKKYHLILQPPFAEKHTFLVDEITANSNYGLTNDIQKINYNRKMLDEAFNIDVKISLLMSEGFGSTFVFALGCFIAVMELQANEQSGRMTFYHCLIHVPLSELYLVFAKRYSPEIAKKWIEVYNHIRYDLNTAKDNVKIHKPVV